MTFKERKMDVSSDIADFASEQVGLWADNLRRAQEMQLKAALGYCESPIEQRLLVALAFIECPFYMTDKSHDPRPAVAGWYPCPIDDAFSKQVEFVGIYLQEHVAGYRVDFLIVAKFADRASLLKIVVECDGHDYHERTKEQAIRDRTMDRTLTAAGFKVFRFTGSEIFRRPRECALEIQRFLASEDLRTREE